MRAKKTDRRCPPMAEVPTPPKQTERVRCRRYLPPTLSGYARCAVEGQHAHKVTAQRALPGAAVVAMSISGMEISHRTALSRFSLRDPNAKSGPCGRLRAEGRGGGGKQTSGRLWRLTRNAAGPRLGNPKRAGIGGTRRDYIIAKLKYR